MLQLVKLVFKRGYTVNSSGGQKIQSIKVDKFLLMFCTIYDNYFKFLLSNATEDEGNAFYN